jgi:hypothetical protein
LTRRGNSLAFQIRFPRDVDLDSSLAPIRVTLGPLPIRAARGKVKRLAGLAELAFDRLRKRKMRGADPATPTTRIGIPVVLAVMRAMDFVGRSNEPDREVARAATDAALDGVLPIAIDSRSGSSDPVDQQGDLLEERFIRVMTDAATGRAHLGVPPRSRPVRRPKPEACWRRSRPIRPPCARKSSI